MVNKQKIKGTQWENQIVGLIQDNIKNSKAKRIAGSGAIGTSLQEPLLTGDIIIDFKSFPKKFRAEAKVGYGGEKQLTLKRDWFNKIKAEAESSYSIPIIICKFLGSRKTDGIQYFVSIDFDTFCSIINYIEDLKQELDSKVEKDNG
jgi:hypothetical protein